MVSSVIAHIVQVPSVSATTPFPVQRRSFPSTVHERLPLPTCTGCAPARPRPQSGQRALADRRLGGLGLLLVLLAVLTMVSLSLGSRPVPLGDIWHALWHPADSAISEIVWHYRVPRTALAIVVGTALGAAGVLMQALTRNPLADPGLLGVHAGAAFAV